MRVAVCQYDGTTTLRALPLAAGLLVANARRDPILAAACDFTIRTRRGEPDDEARALAEVDVVGLSLYTWNERQSLACAAAAKRLSPRLVIVAGGPSVPRRPADAQAFATAHPELDALVFGEGEVTFPAILRALRWGERPRSLPGVAWRTEGGALAFGPPRARLVAEPTRFRDPAAHPHRFDEVASPYLDGTFELLMANGFAPEGAIFETNRGCPFACSFCDWGQATASLVHELPLARVEAELRWAAEQRIPYFYLVDANFGIRKRDLGIIEHLGRLRGETGAPAYCYFHLTKNATRANLQTVLALRAGGIGTQVALSVQDFDPAVLAAVRRDNIAPESALALRAELHARGLPTMNELLLGLPAQTLAGFRASVVQALTPFPGDSFHLYLTRLLVNAPLAAPEERARHGLETRVVPATLRDSDAAVIETEEIVVGTRAMAVADWRRAFAFGFLTSALHNQRVLALTLRVLGHGPGAAAGAGGPEGTAREAWLTRLTERALTAPAESALGAIGRELTRRADAILAEEAQVLPVAGAGARGREPTEAIAALVARDADRFYAEVAEETAALLEAAGAPELVALFADLLRWERFTLPTWRAETATEAFVWDWLSYTAAAADSGPPRRAPTVVRRAPPPWAAAATFGDFVDHTAAACWAQAQRMDLATIATRGA